MSGKKQREPVTLPPLARTPRGRDPLTEWADTRPSKTRPPIRTSKGDSK